MPFVYMLRCADGTLYTGWTVSLEDRLAAHNRGRASRYTRARLPVKLVYSEVCPDRGTAMRCEAALKKLRRAEKQALIKRYRSERKLLADKPPAAK